MLILGLILVVVSAAVGVLLIVDNNGGTEQTVTMFGRDLTQASMMEVFVAGLVVGAVFLLGLWMIVSAARRARVNRARYREVRREARDAARERDKLAKQVATDKDAVTPPIGTPAATEPAGAPPESRRGATGQQSVITNIKPGDSPTR